MWIIFGIVSVVLIVLVSLRQTKRSRGLPLPPGPTPLPLIGNLFDLPSTISPQQYHKLNEKYGDVVYLSALGKSVVILDTYEAASELLDKRSVNYSDRPHSVMTELIGADWAFVFNGYTDSWRMRRKRFHQVFGPQYAPRYWSLQEDAASRLIQLLLSQPEAYPAHLHFTFGALILRVVYGIDAPDSEDQLVSLTNRGQKIVDDAYTPGRYLVEVLPFLKHIPLWMPGALFKRKAAAWKITMQAMRDKPFEATLDNIRREDSPSSPSIVSDMIDRLRAIGHGEIPPAEDGLARDVTAVAYLGAVDTSLSVVHTFLFAMASHPEVQLRAQAELDAVVGPDRLPRISDRDALPYLNAVLIEVLRWKPTGQLGLPHRSVKDDEYNGFLIPAQTVLITNVWTIARDPARYPDPEKFIPERFLKDGKANPDILNPRAYAFGFGRRICPGQQFGETSVFITMACLLHALVIEPPLDEEGRVALPSSESVKMKEAFLTHPLPLPYRFRARSKTRARF